MTGKPPAAQGTWAYFLDVDGTLLDLAPQPSSVSLPAARRGILQGLIRATGGAVALVSGRRVEDLDRIFGGLVVPAAGVHGLQRRDAAGRMNRAVSMAPAAVDAVREAFRDLGAAGGGLLLEDKGASIAVHYRQAPHLGGAVGEAADALCARFPELVRVNGKMVVELKADGAHKGDAVRAFLHEPPFAGRRPVYVGDDVTDEDAFKAVNGLGGVSLRVGAAQDTAAAYVLDDVPRLYRWLAGLVGDSLGKEGSAMAPGEDRGA